MKSLAALSPWWSPYANGRARLALGAQQGDVFGLVVRCGLILAATGLVVGWLDLRFSGESLPACSTGFGRLIRLRSRQRARYFFWALLASAAPAWRVARLEPTESLREQ